MEKRHPADFVRVQPTGRIGDQKNDGFLRSERTIFQCYAPFELKTKACIEKIDADLSGAVRHWKGDFDTWVFVHNSTAGLGPEVLRHLLRVAELYEVAVLHWGLEELRQQAFLLPAHDLAALFGPPPTREAMMKLGLADLEPVIAQISKLPPAPLEEIRPVPANKIAYNMLSSAVEVLLHGGMVQAPLVRRYFTRRETERDQIAASFRREYDRLRADAHGPDEIFEFLQKFAGGDAIATTTHQVAILACLAYFFETCDIFDEPGDPVPP